MKYNVDIESNVLVTSRDIWIQRLVAEKCPRATNRITWLNRIRSARYGNNCLSCMYSHFSNIIAKYELTLRHRNKKNKEGKCKKSYILFINNETLHTLLFTTHTSLPPLDHNRRNHKTDVLIVFEDINCYRCYEWFAEKHISYIYKYN